jgi:hypothetical protein
MYVSGCINHTQKITNLQNDLNLRRNREIISYKMSTVQHVIRLNQDLECA